MGLTLSEPFLEKYKHISPDWGALGWETYKRTYARWIDEECRYEEWWETCRRVLEGNFNIIINDPTSTVEELEFAYDIMFHLIGLPPGRGLWVSGTEFAKKHGDALVNCWFISVRPQPYHRGEKPKVSMPFCLMFDVSMKGGGTGFSVREQDVQQIPMVGKSVILDVVCRLDHPDWSIDNEKARLTPELVPNTKYESDVLWHVVEDSREGWWKSLAVVIDNHFEGNANRIVLDISNVRGYGASIKGFGGKASGPRALVELLTGVNQLLNYNAGKKLTTVNVTDIMNMIGRCVIAGNVRRTAQIALSDPNHQFLDMKNFDIVDPVLAKDENGWVIWEDGRRRLKAVGELDDSMSPEEIADMYYVARAQDEYRWASNNSLVVDSKFKNWSMIANGMRRNGEPGYGNIDLIKNYGRIADGYQENIDGDAEGLNPCGETPLANGEPCNLGEVFPLRARQRNVPMDRVLYIMTRYCYRVTFATCDWEVSADIIAKNRRIGVSLSGIQDWVLEEFGRVFTGWRLIPGGVRVPVYVNKEFTDTLDHFYSVVKHTNLEYAKALGSNPSIKLTVVKPSGTVSLLPGVSPGMHWHYFDYGIRRMRFQMDDPLLKILQYCGYYMEPDVKVPNVMVVEFPVKAPTADKEGFKSAAEVPVYEQFAFQALLAKHWADNAVSCTITFHPEEADQLEALLEYYSDKIKSTTCLPYSGHGYAQAPYEPYVEKDGKTPKEQYEEAISKIKYRPVDVYQAFGVTDDGFSELELGSDCAGGACPIR